MSPSCNPRPVLVLGASARSLAQSAVRGGIAIRAIDCFADLDLLETCPSAVRAAGYPDALPGAVAAFPGLPWCYVGGLENRPDLLEQLAETAPLAGCPAAAVRLVRDPGWLGERCAVAGLPMPETHRSPEGLPEDGTFLVKPLAGAGGSGIAAWRGEARDPADRAPRPSRVGRIWQRRVEGLPCSAAFVASNGEATMLLATRQLIGWGPSSGRGFNPGRGFNWSGGMTIQLEPFVAERLTALGRQIAAEAGLVGIFGIDFLLPADGVPVPLEVNPRPTASTELWDRSTGASHAVLHFAACAANGIDVPIRDAALSALAGRSRPGLVHGKAILFARGAFTASSGMTNRWLGLREAWRDRRGLPGVADIPSPGSSIREHGPVVTVFAEAADEQSLLGRLAGRLRVAEEAIVTPPCDAAARPPRPGRDIP